MIAAVIVAVAQNGGQHERGEPSAVSEIRLQRRERRPDVVADWLIVVDANGRQMKSLVLSIVFTALAVGTSAATDDDFWNFATAYKEPKPAEGSAVTTSLLDSFRFLSRGMALAVDFCSNPSGCVLIFR